MREQWGRGKGRLEGGREEGHGEEAMEGVREGEEGRASVACCGLYVTPASCCSEATSVLWDLVMDATTQPIYLTNVYQAPVLSTVATHR